jgi:Xaa-Pro aminopeptidase
MFEPKIYSDRRNKLRQVMKSGIILIPGNNESPMNYPANGYHFRQDSNFLYFFGLNLAGLAGVMDCDSGKDHIFGNDVDIDDIIWMGPQPSMKDSASKAGVEYTAPFADLAKFISEAIGKGRKIYFLPPYRADNKILLESLLGIPIAELKANVSMDLVNAVIAMRSIKDLFEVAEIEKACEIGRQMHIAAMRLTKPGIYEREISGLIEGIALSYGSCVSFPVICSIHGETLHNHYHGNIMKDGDLLITDAGAETEMNYASDYTRTFPVNGKFSPKQKEIYEIVLKANVEAINAIKPGVKYQEIHLGAAKVIAEGLIAAGLMKGNADDAVKAGAHAMFFPHGLGHMMGLDVHDMEDLGQIYVGYDDEVRPSEQFGTAYLRLGRRLQPGFVLTVEPGIYFIPALIDQWKTEGKFEEFICYDKVEEYKDFGGIRIEDDILVTTSGYRLLGTPVPKTVAEVEEMMKK